MISIHHFGRYVGLAHKSAAPRSIGLFCLFAANLLFWVSLQSGEQRTFFEGRVKMQEFGKDRNGQPVHVFTVKNAEGMEVRAMDYGGILISVRVPDRKGGFGDVVLGFDGLDGYLENKPYFGAIIGRYANRIANAKFTLNGREYWLPANDGRNTLHGGVVGFDKVLWKALPAKTQAGTGVSFEYKSPDGEQGFPGTVKAKVTYLLSDKNVLPIDYQATTDHATPINLTNHSYFNLAGPSAADILEHELTLEADQFTPVDSGLIPTGELRDVAGSPFDFRKPTPIGARINHEDEQLKLAKGYDHNWVLRDGQRGQLSLAARVHEPSSGRTLEVWTTEPGIQFYSGNFLDGSVRGKGGVAYPRRSGFCLETQHYPDSPNHKNFPSTILAPDAEYHNRTVYKFLSQ